MFFEQQWGSVGSEFRSQSPSAAGALRSHCCPSIAHLMWFHLMSTAGYFGPLRIRKCLPFIEYPCWSVLPLLAFCVSVFYHF